jgi:hypothetical protein
MRNAPENVRMILPTGESIVEGRRYGKPDPDSMVRSREKS